MKWSRILVLVAPLGALSVACGDGTDGAPSDGGTDSGGGSGATTNGGGTGGDSDGDGGTTSGGGSSDGGTSTGGGSSGDLDELFADALEDCAYRALAASVQYSDRDFANLLESSLTASMTTIAEATETLEVETFLGHTMRLTWPASAQPGDRVAVSGFLHDEDGAESRDRCFDGEVNVRVELGGEAFFVFASRTLYEATPDGTCGAPTTDEVTLGCVSEDFQ